MSQGLERLQALTERLTEDGIRATNDAILLVDDDPSVLVLVKCVFERAGFKILITDSGCEAIRLAGQEQPLAAIVDLNLPDISGLEVIVGIKTKSPGTKILIYTAFPSQTSAIESIRLGIEAYIVKTEGIEAVLAAIKEIT